jgi:hypothetical protein
MNEPTLEGFISWVNTQKPDMVIDQNSWTTCASGRYLKSCNLNFVTVEIAGTFGVTTLAPVGKALSSRTYGELQECIASGRGCDKQSIMRSSILARGLNSMYTCD